MSNIFEQIREITKFRDIVIHCGYCVDGGHGDMVPRTLVKVTWNGEDPYHIVDKKFICNPLVDNPGIECVQLYRETDLEKVLTEFYAFLQKHLS